MSMERKEDDSCLSLEEKLQIIDDEIRTLHHFCVTQGYDPWQIQRNAQPILGAVKSARRKKLLVNLGKLCSILLILTALWHYDPVYRLTCSFGRLAAIQVLPYWDWTTLYGQECLVNNPYFVGHRLQEEDCELCEHLEYIDRIQNVSHSILMEDYLKRDIPVIITDGMDHWIARDLFNMQFLNNLYATDPALVDVLPCMFASNVRIKYGNPRALLELAARGDITNWYAHWENCEKNAAKVLRQFYKRPYFIPPMVEMAEPNWIFLASQYRGKKNKPADIALPMMWMAQLKGQIKVRLTPRSPCNSTCSTLYNTLHEGDILVMTDMMWLLDYLPISSGDTIAIGSGGFFD